jgi:nicotinic acid phosphoribosyltransferase
MRDLKTGKTLSPSELSIKLSEIKNEDWTKILTDPGKYTSGRLS